MSTVMHTAVRDVSAPEKSGRVGSVAGKSRTPPAEADNSEWNKRVIVDFPG